MPSPIPSRRAVAVADKQFVLDIDRRYEVVVAVAPYPMDCNFYQTNKAIQGGAAAVKDGGVLIVVSECPFGLGENQTLYDMLAAAESPAAALERADQEEYRLGVQQATRVAGVLQRADIYAVTSLPDEQVRAMFMKPFASVQDAVDAALATQDLRTRRCCSSMRPASPCRGRARRAGRRSRRAPASPRPRRAASQASIRKLVLIGRPALEHRPHRAELLFGHLEGLGDLVPGRRRRVITNSSEISVITVGCSSRRLPRASTVRPVTGCFIRSSTRPRVLPAQTARLVRSISRGVGPAVGPGPRG